MNTIQKTIILFIIILQSLLFQSLHAQWKTYSAQVRDSDLIQLGNQKHADYKGFPSMNFKIQTAFQKEKRGGKSYLTLKTGEAVVDDLYSYWYKPGFNIKGCHYGKLSEINHYSFDTSQLGNAPFEHFKKTAFAIFDMEVSYFATDKNGTFTGILVFKNVTTNGTYLNDVGIEGDVNMDRVRIIKSKATSFKADESKMLPAINDYVKRFNEKIVANCKQKD